MVEIKQLPGFKLNPNDKIVNGILKRCEKIDGICPCIHDTGEYEGKDLHCPCTDYTRYGNCICGLYVKDRSMFFFDKKSLPQPPHEWLVKEADLIGEEVFIEDSGRDVYTGILLSFEYSHEFQDWYYVIKNTITKEIEYLLAVGCQISPKNTKK